MLAIEMPKRVMIEGVKYIEWKGGINLNKVSLQFQYCYNIFCVRGLTSQWCLFAETSALSLLYIVVKFLNGGNLIILVHL